MRDMTVDGSSRIVVLAPHTDDGELGAGGSIARWIEEGNSVTYVAFSTAEASVPPNFPPNTLAREVRRATRLLGVPKENLVVFDYQVRRFFERRQDILDDLVSLGREMRPDLVVMPSLGDLHQDHTTVASEATRAFKNGTILSYEMPWNNLSFQNTLFVGLEARHIEAKITALAEYRSQAHRKYVNEQFVRSQALFRGTQIGVPAAEVFEVVRMVL